MINKTFRITHSKDPVKLLFYIIKKKIYLNNFFLILTYIDCTFTLIVLRLSPFTLRNILS